MAPDPDRTHGKVRAITSRKPDSHGEQHLAAHVGPHSARAGQVDHAEPERVRRQTGRQRPLTRAGPKRPIPGRNQNTNDPHSSSPIATTTAARSSASAAVNGYAASVTSTSMIRSRPSAGRRIR